ncbi:MAG: zinc ABC transporter substrate-binding protein [Deltaproteobacteria bacterium]|nr:zinc ABC transporter substrate-binding protein [Deltaproteobacteria bacterium]
MGRLNQAAVFCLVFSILAGTLAKTTVSAERTGDRIKVFVSIEPQAFFVEQVGGENVDVEVLLPSGQSPRSFEPLPRQLAELARARVFFRIGVPYEERMLSKISSMFTGLEVVDTRKGIEFRYLDEHGGHAPSSASAHSGEGPDPHIWLDPGLVKIQAKNICEGLGRIDPDHAGAYRSNLLAFNRELDELDARIAGMLAPFRGRAVYVFHPAYGYFTERYGLRQVAVETGGREPSARELAELINRMRQDRVNVIFIQPEFSGTVVSTLQNALDCSAVRINPLAREYIRNLEKMAESISQALKAR